MEESHLKVPEKPPANPPDAAKELMQKLRSSWQPDQWCELNVAIALSGGADSVSLLRALWETKQQSGGSGKVIALHVNHQLRDRDSDEDARWCLQLCQNLGLPIEIIECDTQHYIRQTGEGIEAAARFGRYEMLTSIAEKHGARYLVTAHTLDDQVETVLFRILRGTGLRGLGGIPLTRKLTPSLTLVRPMLDCSRDLILKYLSQLNQSFRTDQSNTDEQFTRNRLRNQLLPQLREEFNPELNLSLLRLASQASEAQQTLESLASGLLEAAEISQTSNSITCQLQPFTNQDITLVREALRIAWREAGLPEQAMSYQWWNRLATLVKHPSDAERLSLPGKVRASTAGTQLLIQW